jgi:nucleoside 2-deoxyribosyltransferase
VRVFLSIKFHSDQRNRALIESLCAALESQGWQTCVIVRDIEQWGAVEFSPPALMQRTFEEIRASDLVLVEFSEKGVGLGIEAGYAYAFGKPLVALAKSGSDLSTTLQGIASQVIWFDDIESAAAVLCKRAD